MDTSDPGRSIHRKMETQPFLPLQEQSSVRGYTNMFVRLLCFLIRAGDHPGLLHLTARQQTARMALQNVLAMKEASDSQLMHGIHKLAWTFVSTCYEEDGLSALGSEANPMALFLAWSNLSHDGSFENPSLITPRLSQLQYTFRSVVFHQVLIEAKEAQRGQTE